MRIAGSTLLLVAGAISLSGPRAQVDPGDLFRKLPGAPKEWKGEEGEPDAGAPDGGAEAAPDPKPAEPPPGEPGAVERFGSEEAPSGRVGAEAAVGGRVEADVPGASTHGASERNLDLGGGDGRRVVVIPIDGTIDLGLAPFVRRVVEEAGAGAAAVVLDVNTFGGRVDAAVQIRDALLSSTVPTVAFVNRRAISAGALISLACDVIAVTDGATMGAATPVQMGGGGQAQPVAEKVVSYMRKEMRSTAEAKGRSGDVAEAMVDADVEVEGLVEKGKLLTLTTTEGLDHGVFDVKAQNMTALLEALNLNGATIEKAHVNWAEKVARILTDPVVSGLLMTFGFLGLLMELYTAGFGLTGIIGITCLLLFFLGHVVADLAGWEELLLFGLGVAFIVAELFGLGHGLGILGLTGAAFIVASLVMALVEAPLDLSWATGALAGALTRVAIAMVATVLGGLLLARAVPRTGLARRLVLDTGLGSSRAIAPDVETDDGEPLELVGQEGVVLTSLHPFGKARIGGRKLEVTSDGSFVEVGRTVRVLRVEGRNVVVREVAAPAAPAAPDEEA